MKSSQLDFSIVIVIGIIIGIAISIVCFLIKNKLWPYFSNCRLGDSDSQGNSNENVLLNQRVTQNGDTQN